MVTTPDLHPAWLAGNPSPIEPDRHVVIGFSVVRDRSVCSCGTIAFADHVQRAWVSADGSHFLAFPDARRAGSVAVEPAAEPDGPSSVEAMAFDRSPEQAPAPRPTSPQGQAKQRAWREARNLPTDRRTAPSRQPEARRREYQRAKARLRQTENDPPAPEG